VGAEFREAMRRVNWARIYNAYFRSMVVEQLTDLSYRTLGEDAGFKKVADITMKGTMAGFRVLHEETAKAGMNLRGLSLKEILDYQYRCHDFAIKGMNVPFQLWEKIVEVEPEKKYYMETERCQYADIAKKNPVVCAVCVGFVAGILTQFGKKTRWLRRRERARQLCMSEDRPDYIVYRDPSVPWPGCRLVIEKLDCDQILAENKKGNQGRG